MPENKQSILGLIGGLIFVACVTSWMIYSEINADKDLKDLNRREAIYKNFEDELKSIELPSKMTIKSIEKHGKSGVSVYGSITYQTDLQKKDAITQVSKEMIKKGWSLWKIEDSSLIFCKDKFEASANFCCETERQKTEVGINLSLGLGHSEFLGEPKPKECIQ